MRTFCLVGLLPLCLASCMPYGGQRIMLSPPAAYHNPPPPDQRYYRYNSYYQGQYHEGYRYYNPANPGNPHYYNPSVQTYPGNPRYYNPSTRYDSSGRPVPYNPSHPSGALREAPQ
jgi:hypothetical protein